MLRSIIKIAKPAVKSGANLLWFCYISLMDKDRKSRESARFDLVYNQPEMAFGSEPEPELANYVQSHEERGKALDLGCGDGRHAFFLAEEGFHVTAVDFSPVAINKLGSISRVKKLDQVLELHHSDARDFKYPKNSFDLVAAVTLFDHLTKADVRPLFAKVAASLKRGGVLFMKVHTVKDPGKINGSDKASELAWAIHHYFESDELKSLLKKDFEIIKYSEYDDLDKSHGRPHFHNFAMALAKKV
jgi:cyclopropane fatty-acyl-phospholipid synthase-like methyltransferase